MPKISGANVAEHRERTYRSLLDAVEGLIQEQGFDAVSMRDIAERAGVSRTAIYNYAPDKMALLEASVERTAAALHTALTEAVLEPGRSAPDRLEAVMRVLLTFAHSAQNLLMLRAAHATLDRAHRKRVISGYQDEIGEHLRALVLQGIADGDYAPVADPDLTVEMITGVVDVAIERVIARPDEADVAKEYAITFLQRALGRAAKRVD